MPEQANERQVGGDHYKAEIQHWDVVAVCYAGRYLEGQITKYLTRWLRKGTPLQDLEKARHYLEKLVESIASGVQRPLSGAPSPDAEGFMDEFLKANKLHYMECGVLRALMDYEEADLQDVTGALDELLSAAKASEAVLKK